MNRLPYTAYDNFWKYPVDSVGVAVMHELTRQKSRALGITPDLLANRSRA